MRRTIVTVVVLLGIVYAAICLAFYRIQNSLTFFPTRGLNVSPADVHLTFETVHLHVEDGVDLVCWVIPASPAAPTKTPTPWVLILHGNGGNMAGRVPMAQMLHAMGLSVMMFDYRGYGLSSGSPSEEGFYRDAEAAWNWLTATRKVDPHDVVLWGESMGGGVATWLAARHAPRAMVLQSTFTSIPDVGARQYPWLPVHLLCRNRFASIERIGDIKCPLLFMHSKDDGIVPYEIGKRLFDASHEPHQWLDTTGGHGVDLHTQPPAVVDALRRFLGVTQEARPRGQ